MRNQIESLKILIFFEPIRVSKDIEEKNGRLKIKISNNKEGWVDSRFVSYPAISWKKNYFDKVHYCYIPLDLVMNLTVNRGPSWAGYYYTNIEIPKAPPLQGTDVMDGYYSNNNYNIGLGINNEFSFQSSVKQSIDAINSEITTGGDKRLNWRKEFTFGKYRISYTITTHDPNRWVHESFDYAKSDELDKNKRNSFYTTYDGTKSINKILTQRKMLFSSLESLQNH